MADILLGNVKGPQGNTGATGSQGPQGEAATITVGTVSTTAYGNTAQVINSGTEQDAVLDFVIPQGKPGEQTTRMGALTLDTITAQSADFPIPAVGETGSTVFGKIIKFFNSTISALNSKLNISDVVNNLTSTSTTQPLSAAQGKALNDALGSYLKKSGIVLSNVSSYGLAADTPRTINQEGSTGSPTLDNGFYILVSESSTNSNSFSGRTLARFTGSGVVGMNTFVPPTVSGLYYAQLIQFIYVTSGSATVMRSYYDTVATGANHIWNIYKVIAI